MSTSTKQIGSPWNAAISSFLFFASGALIPVLPYLFGARHLAAVVIAAGAVGLALLGTGAIVGVLSGASPWKRALRQLLIGFGGGRASRTCSGCLFGARRAVRGRGQDLHAVDVRRARAGRSDAPARE